MVSGEAAEQAVELARARPRLAVGLHLVLVCGRSALRPAEIPHLVDPQGNFPYSPFISGLRYYFSRQVQEQLRREINAQVEKFVQTGLPFSHIDGHLHMHMHPTVFAILADAAERYGVKRIRLPRENLFHTLRLRRTRLGTKLLWWTVFQLLSRHAEKRLRGRGFLTAERVYGLLESGAMTEDYWLGLLPQLSASTNEIYCHPEIAGLARDSSNRFGEQELKALLSAQVKSLLNAQAIELITYRDLERD